MRGRVLLTGLRKAAVRWPRASLAATHAVAQVTWPLERRFDAQAVREVLPDLDRAALARARRRAWSSALKRQVLDVARLHPGARWPYPRVVSGPDPASLEPPLVLVTFHIGPMSALASLLEQLPGDVLALEGGQESVFRRPGLEVLTVDISDPWRRAFAYRRALKSLEAGGYVFIAIDGRGTVPVHAPLFGRTVGLARGAVALALTTGAPILPLAARWRGWAVEIIAGELIPPGDEEAMAAATTRFLEDYVLETPEEIDRHLPDLLHSLD